MIKNKLILSFLVVCLLLTFFVSSVKADTVETDVDFGLDFLTTEAFAYQDLTQGFTITFTISDGNLTGTANLETTDAGGTLTITPTDSGVIAITATDSNYTLSVDGVESLSPNIQFLNGIGIIISWVYDNIVLPDYPEILNIKPFWQYLFSGNFLGFFGALFTWSFIIQDILVGAFCMLFLVPIYIRTKSLLLLAVIWILLGASFITLMPSVSGLAIIFLILGIGSVLWKLVHPN